MHKKLTPFSNVAGDRHKLMQWLSLNTTIPWAEILTLPMVDLIGVFEAEIGYVEPDADLDDEQQLLNREAGAINLDGNYH